MNLTTEKIDMPEAIHFILGRFDMEGWLCSALFKNFQEAPPAIYVKAEAKKA